MIIIAFIIGVFFGIGVMCIVSAGKDEYHVETKKDI